MFIAQLQDPTFAGRDLTSLRTGIMAGSPCPIEVMRQVIDAHGRPRDDDRLRPDRGLAGDHANAATTIRWSCASRPSAGRCRAWK